ncbi:MULTISPECIES: SDR family oxidoreductase [unclassified Phenylobacterium]|uniref:SDR family oxidoreductase n=1 Tax=unclassified Phenylobacterium TaxID=2640670 RepID=UPI00083A843D|nr:MULTISPECIES: SDR family oxidoreductase [unclassified Phenylobacterium]
MSTSIPRLLVTGASGQLGRLVIEHLLQTTSAAQIVAVARAPSALADLAARGVEVRQADYAAPEALDAAFAGIDRLLLISSNAVGQRVQQHLNAIAAAKKAGVGLVAYTSVLRADASVLGLAEEHRQTEAALAASGLPYVLLRNGWYTENYTASIPAALAHGALMGSAGEGRISSAPRADYAAAAATVLASAESQAGRVYELAGDESYTLADFAAELARQTGKPVGYRNLPEGEFKAALIGAGLPEAVAALLSDSDAAAAKGALFDDDKQLGRLIGRPTGSLAASIAKALPA